LDFIFEGLREGFGLIFGGDPEILGIVLFSLKVAVISTVVSCLIGIPIGFFVGTSRFWGRRAAITVLNTMLAFPTVVIGLWVWGILSRNGPLGELGVLYSLTAIVIAEVILAVPIAAALTASAVQSADPRIHRTALTLGAGPFRANLAVASHTRFAIISAIVVAFGRVLAEVGAATIVGGNIRHQTRTLTTAVALATSRGSFGTAMAFGLILVALALTVNIMLQVFQGRGDA
jgi:tungstate transport system permease protein